MDAYKELQKQFKSPSEYQKAIHTLSKFFKLTTETFHSLSDKSIITWADRIISLGSKYLLSREEHCFLIGQIKFF